MKTSSILLERNRTQIVSLIKHASRGIALAAISIFLLISIIGLKAYKTELGYELTKSINTYSKISIENKKPIGNGVLTCLNKDQALARVNKGLEAANATIQVLNNEITR